MNRGLVLSALLGGLALGCTGETGTAPNDVGAPDATGLDGSAEIDAASTMDAPAEDAAAPTPDAPDAPETPDAGLPFEDAGPAPEGCITDVLRGGGHARFTCGAIAYDVEVPSALCSSLGGCGLVLDVHGATMDATSQDLNTNLRALGSAAGYVVVQPSAPGAWWDPATHDAQVFAFVTLAMRAFRIDPDRVHMTGFSQGGFMTWRMLCDHADVFASVAPGAACGALFPTCAFSGTDRPSEEIPVLYMHGVDDAIVAGCRTEMRDRVIAGWAMTPSGTVSMDGAHTWSRWTSASGNVFEFVEHRYHANSTIVSGHCFPGSPDTSGGPFATNHFGCADASAFTWGEAVMAFFVAHPRTP